MIVVDPNILRVSLFFMMSSLFFFNFFYGVGRFNGHDFTIASRFVPMEQIPFWSANCKDFLGVDHGDLRGRPREALVENLSGLSSSSSAWYPQVAQIIFESPRGRWDDVTVNGDFQNGGDLWSLSLWRRTNRTHFVEKRGHVILLFPFNYFFYLFLKKNCFKILFPILLFNFHVKEYERALIQKKSKPIKARVTCGSLLIILEIESYVKTRTRWGFW